MPKQNMFALLGFAAALFACPALADGRPGTPTFQGPAPLSPSHKSELQGGQHDWSCPMPAVTHQPVQPVFVQPAAPQPASYDFSGFGGGVGAGVDGGFFGGGGAFIIVGSDRRYSGVLSAPAARIAFHREKRVGPRAPGPSCAGRC